MRHNHSNELIVISIKCMCWSYMHVYFRQSWVAWTEIDETSNTFSTLVLYTKPSISCSISALLFKGSIHQILLITIRHINVLHEDITYIQYYMAKWSYIITLGHINVLHEDITYIQCYMAKWSYIIKNIKTYQQFSLWTMITFYKLLHYKKIGDHSF
jgi:hypothetical protein